MRPSINPIDGGSISMRSSHLIARRAPGPAIGFGQGARRRGPLGHLTSTIKDRAPEVMALLVDRGQHRAPSTSGLVLAATAGTS